MTSDREDLERNKDDPDVERRDFFRAALGLLHSTRVRTTVMLGVVVVILIAELVGRLLQMGCLTGWPIVFPNAPGCVH